jgi:hypothetical protein
LVKAFFVLAILLLLISVLLIVITTEATVVGLDCLRSVLAICFRRYSLFLCLIFNDDFLEQIVDRIVLSLLTSGCLILTLFVRAHVLLLLNAQARSVLVITGLGWLPARSVDGLKVDFVAVLVVLESVQRP